MAVRVKFPLKMPDGTQARTIEDLREHFDYNSVLGYYQNGKLETWLKDRDYTKESQRIGCLRPSSDGLMKEICEILGVEYSESKAPTVSMNSVAMKNTNYERLKQYTADDEILNNADKVAFSQDELLGLLDKGEKKIYLCGDNFVIPCDIDGVKYIGVNEPKITINGDVVSEGIEIENAICDLSNYEGNYADFENTFHNNPKLGFRLLNKYLDYLKGRDMTTSNDNYIELIKILSWCYYLGFGTEKNNDKFVKYCTIAVEHNDAEAQNDLAYYYEDNEKYEEAVKWYNRAAQQDYGFALNKMGCIYYYGDCVDKDLTKAIQFWSRAAQKGEPDGMSNLGFCYIEGEGVEQNEKRGIQLLWSAYKHGNKQAISYLIRYKSDIVDFTDALLYVIGGRKNLSEKNNVILLKYYNMLVVKVENIEKIHYQALLVLSKSYNTLANDIAFFIDDNIGEKQGEATEALILLDRIKLDNKAVLGLEKNVRLEKLDTILDSYNERYNVERLVDELHNAKDNHNVIRECKTFQDDTFDLISGKKQIEERIECLELMASQKE